MEEKICNLCQKESCDGSKGPVNVLCLRGGLEWRYEPKGKPLFFEDGSQTLLKARSIQFPMSTIAAITFKSLGGPALVQGCRKAEVRSSSGGKGFD
jgi:hypothetical protein